MGQSQAPCAPGSQTGGAPVVGAGREGRGEALRSGVHDPRLQAGDQGRDDAGRLDEFADRGGEDGVDEDLRELGGGSCSGRSRPTIGSTPTISSCATGLVAWMAPGRSPSPISAFTPRTDP